MYLSLRAQCKIVQPLEKARSSSAPPPATPPLAISIPWRYQAGALLAQLPFPVLGSASAETSLLGGKGAGPQKPRRRTAAAAMAVPGSLNRYLLLMAQEHLEFRLPVSRPGVPDAETRTPSLAGLGVSGQPRAPGLGRGRVRSLVGWGSSGDLSPGPNQVIHFSAREPGAAVKQENLIRPPRTPRLTEDTEVPWGRSGECEKYQNMKFRHGRKLEGGTWWSWETAFCLFKKRFPKRV